MKTEHNGIEISYDENKNSWLFDLRGRSRSADSLAKAKEAIDKEPKEKRAQTFPRTEAYLWNYEGFKVVTVTSVAEEGYYGAGKSFWVNDGTKRKKERFSSLYPVNEHNTDLVDAIKAKDAERERISEQIESLKEKLKPIEVPKEIL